MAPRARREAYVSAAPATADTVAVLVSDSVVLATGFRPRRTPWHDGDVAVADADEVIAAPAVPHGTGAVVVIDPEGGFTASDLILLAGARTARNDLFRTLVEALPSTPVRRVGDALAPRGLRDAVAEKVAAGDLVRSGGRGPSPGPGSRSWAAAEGCSHSRAGELLRTAVERRPRHPDGLSRTCGRRLTGQQRPLGRSPASALTS